jgi:hypothetical protein
MTTIADYEKLLQENQALRAGISAIHRRAQRNEGASAVLDKARAGFERELAWNVAKRVGEVDFLTAKVRASTIDNRRLADRNVKLLKTTITLEIMLLASVVAGILCAVVR